MADQSITIKFKSTGSKALTKAIQNLTDADNRALTAKLDTAVTIGSIDSCKLIVHYYIYDNS